MFDKKFNSQNSLVKSILSVFFQNFHLLSKNRCYMLFNAVTKIFYAHITAKYSTNKAVPKKNKNKRQSSESDSSNSVSEFDADEVYDSADSEHKLSRVKVS